jgi:hypothetical protein
MPLAALPASGWLFHETSAKNPGGRDVSFCLFAVMRNHRLMKQLMFVALGLMLGTWMAQAELRTFTNTDGRKAEGELLVVEDGTAVVRLANDSIAKIPLESLSADDRTFVTKWWEENKDKLGPMDLRLAIDRNSDRIDRTVTRPKGGGGAQKQPTNQITKKLTIDEFNYTCTLKNYTRKKIANITAEYTIYKRSIGRDKNGLANDTDEIKGEKTITLLDAMETTTFDTEKVKCEDSSESGGQAGGKSQMIWKRETILGIVVTISVGGKELIKQSDPENFIARLREAEKREDSRE